VALPDSCSYAGYLGVSTLHKFKIYIFSWLRQQWFLISQLHLRRNQQLLHSMHLFKDLAGYPRILCIIDLRPLRGRHAYKGLPEVGPARLLAAMLGDLGVSTLRSIKTMTQFSSLLSIKPAMLPASMLGDYSTSASSTPSCFPCGIDLLGNLFLLMSLLDLLFLLFFFFGPSYRPSCPPRCSDTTHECIFDAL
jgi:hypothetical protein